MSHFEYISVLFSIVIAFGISEVVSGWGRLLRSREQVRFYWIHAAWSLLLLLLMAEFWWGFWQYRVLETWDFVALVVTLGEFLTLVLIAFLITPETGPGELDLRAFYYRNHAWIFSLGALVQVQLAVGEALVADQPFFHAENLVRGAATALLVWLARTRNERVHGAAAIVCSALFAGFLTIAFQRS